MKFYTVRKKMKIEYKETDVSKYMSDYTWVCLQLYE